MDINEDFELEIKRDIYRNSYYEFFKDAVRVLEPETNWKFNWHIEEACNIFQEAIERVVKKEQKPYDLSFNLPPSSSKSMIFSVCPVPWIWSFAPHIRYFTESHSFKLKTEHSQKTTTIIKSEWYQKLYGDKFSLVRANDELIQNDSGGWRRAGIQIGMHADIGVGDDLIDSQNVSDAFILQADNLWFKKVPSRFRDLSFALRVLVMQRLSQNDPCGKIKAKNLNYRHFVVPVTLTKDLEPYEKFKHKYENSENSFWPEKFPNNVIQEAQKTLSESDYASQYLQSPSPPDGGIIKRDWISIVEPYEVSISNDDTVHFFLDTSYTNKTSNDPNAYLACFKRGDNLYIINVHEEWLSITKNIPYIQSYVTANRYSPKSLIYIEPKASGKDIVDILREKTGLNVTEAKNPINDKLMRLNSASPFIRGGRVIFVNGNYLDNLLEQLCTAPFNARWDMIDCLSMAVDELLMNESDGFWFV